MSQLREDVNLNEEVINCTENGLMPQIVLLTGREILGKRLTKLGLKELEIYYYVKKPEQVCIIFSNSFFIVLQ